MAVSAALAAGPALAASGDWSATTSGNWSDTANWTGGIEASGAGFTATFASDIPAGTTTVTLDAARTLNSVIFGDAGTGTAGSWDIGGTARLTLTPTPANSTGSATITVNALGTNATATISVPLTVTNNGGTFVKNGVGRLILANTAASPNSNTIGGKTAITGGTLQISADTQLGGPPGSFVANHLTISNGASLRTSAAMTLATNRGVTISTGGGTLNLNGGAMTYSGRFTGPGQTLTTAGASGLTLKNTTGVATDVDWDLTGTGTRIFFENTNALGTGSVQVRNNVRLVSQAAAIGTVGNAITLASGGGISARTGAATFSNVAFPSTGTVVFNKDDLATFGLTISSNATLSGNLTVDTSQQAAAAVGDVTLSGIFSGASGGITKAGTGASGKLILAGANTYGGTTTISTGTLALAATGSIAESAQISVASGATFDVSAVSGFTLGAAQTLDGVGSVLGSVTANGTLSPGLAGGAGTLSFGNDLALGSGSILTYQLNGTDFTVGGAVNDLVTLSGNLTLDGTLNVADSPVGSFSTATLGNSWRLFNYTGSLVDNTLSLGTMPTLGEGLTFGLDMSTPGQVNLVVTAVPEPATIVTVAAGLGIVGATALRRRLARRA